MLTTYTKPPKKILDVLHAAEKLGMDLPPEIDVWWEEETFRQSKEAHELDREHKKE